MRFVTAYRQREMKRLCLLVFLATALISALVAPVTASAATVSIASVVSSGPMPRRRDRSARARRPRSSGRLATMSSTGLGVPT